MDAELRVARDEESLGGGERIQPLPFTPMSELFENEDGYKRQASIALGDRLGLQDFLSMNVWRASLGELLGTAALVFMIDTIVISTFQSKIDPPNLILSILIAVTVSILLLATIPISGGHINPVVSFSAALVGVISITRAAIYIAAQCVGALLGALALGAVVSSTIEQSFSLGGCTLTVIWPGPNGPVTTGLETAQALWLEMICTFVLLFTSVWMVFDGRQAKALGHMVLCLIVGTVLGLLVYVSTSVTGAKGYAGAGMNPARCLGPAIVRGGHLWSGHWVFWVGPAIACVAFYLYTRIIPSQHFLARGYKHDFFNILKALFVEK